MSAFIDLWNGWILGSSASTERARRGDLLALSIACGHTPPDPQRVALELVTGDAAHARAIAAMWSARMLAEDLAASTIARRLSSLRSWVSACHAVGLPWLLSIENPRRVVSYQRVRRCPPWADVEAAIARLERETASTNAGDRARARRDLALVQLLSYSGMRIGSVLALRRCDVIPHRERPHVLAICKGGASVARSCSHRTMRALLDLCDDRVADLDLVFDLSPSGARERVRRLGFDSPHMLRHAAATELRRRGASASDLQSFLSHASLSTTDDYIHELDDAAGRGTAILAGEHPWHTTTTPHLSNGSTATGLSALLSAARDPTT